MRLTLPCILLLAALPLACGPKNDTTDTDASTGGTDATTGPATTTTTADPTTTSATGQTTTTTGATTTSATGQTTEEPGTTSTTGVAPTTGEPDTTSTTGLETTTGVIPGEIECSKDADCKLHDDCCTCEGVPVDEDVVSCDLDCRQSKCSELGISKAVCNLGVCETQRLSCDAAKVACDSLPPPCPAGQVAETTPICWSGKCVPAELCDVVPDCELCPDTMICVQNIAFTTESRCEPRPPACPGELDCACVGELVCEQPFGLCSVADDVVHCECPNC